MTPEIAIDPRTLPQGPERREAMHEMEYVRVEPCEVFVLPGKRAVPMAKIRLGVLDGEWFQSVSYDLPDCGGGGPLGYWTNWKSRGSHASRDAALTHAIARLRDRFTEDADRGQLILDWLDNLEAGMRQPDLFGEQHD